MAKKKSNARYNYVALYVNKQTGEKQNYFIQNVANANDAREIAHDMMCKHVETQLERMHMSGFVADACMISINDAETIVQMNWRCVSCKRGANVSTQGQTGKRRVRRSGKSGEVRVTTMKEERAKQAANSAA